MRASSRILASLLVWIVAGGSLSADTQASDGVYPPAESQEAASTVPERDGTWDLLRRLAAEAPARQVGQPGNKVIDRWVGETFQRFTAAQGGMDAAAYETARTDYDLLVRELLDSRDAIFLEEVSPALMRGGDADRIESARPSFSQSLLRNPAPLAGVLVAALIMLGVAWWYQRRVELLWVAGGFLLLLAGVLVASAGMRASDEREREMEERAQDRFERAAEALLAAAAEAREVSASAWRRGRLTHHTAAFVPGDAYLEAEGRRVRIYQLAPNLADPANFPAEIFEGPLQIAGGGAAVFEADGPPQGSVVVLDFDSGRQWLNLVEAGAGAIVLLEPETIGETHYEALGKISNAPLSIPRFYLRREDARVLFGGEVPLPGTTFAAARIEQEAARWERQPVHADWLFIPGPEGVPPTELVHIQTYKDAASIVPQLSPGAESLMNLAAIEELLEGFVARPPERPVLVSVVNDHCNALNGEYVFSAFAFTPPEVLAEELDRLDLLHSRQLLVAGVYGQEPDEMLMEYLRDSIERVAGRSFTVKEPAVNYLMMRRNTLRGEHNLLTFQLDDGELQGTEAEAARERLAEINAEVEEVISLLGLFNRFGHKTYFADLDESGRESLRRLFRRLASEAAREAESLDAERREVWENLAFRAWLPGGTSRARGLDFQDLLRRAFPPLPSLLGLHLDLGAGSSELGLFFEGAHRDTGNRYPRARVESGQRTSRLARLALTLSATIADETGEAPFLRDTILGAGGQPWAAHVGMERPFGSAAFHQHAHSALTLATVSDSHPVLFTPSDNLDRLDRTTVERNLRLANTLIERLVSSPELPGTTLTRGSPMPLTIELTVRQMDRFSVEIPRTVLPGAVVVGSSPQTPVHEVLLTYSGQVRIFPILMADGAGRLPLRGERWRFASVLSFGFSPDFRRTTSAQDLGDNERRFSSTLSVTDRVMYAHRSVVTFECEKTDLLGFTDPLTLEPLDEVEVLDARSDTRPRHYSLAGIRSSVSSKRIPASFDGAISVFMQPGIPFKLRSGRVIAINTTSDDIRGIGFQPDVGLIRNLPLVMAWDYQRLAAARLALLTARGVSSDYAEAFELEARQGLEEVEAADAPRDRIISSEVARGLAYRAYSATVQTINDLVQAVVILLALIVPFCFFLVKLISPFTDVNRQLMLFMAVFALFAGLLYFIQPAFAVGERPEVVILAFVILGLALFVASVIIGKFDAAMNQAVEESQLSESADAPQGRLAGVAFMVGVNNMKRRRIRTTLTCATIVLVTFTILSVISIRQDAEPLRLRVGAEAPYDGFVFTKPGVAPIDPAQMERLRAHFHGKATTVLRAWTARQDDTGSYLLYRFQADPPVPGAELSHLEISMILGLEPGEKNFITDLQSPTYLVPGSRWFSAANAAEVMLSRRAAELLGIRDTDFVGRGLILDGRRYEIVALFEDGAFTELADLRNLPILPLKVDATAEDMGEAAQGADITQMPGISPTSPLEVVFLPAETARSLGSTTNRVLGVRFEPRAGETAEEVAARLWEATQRFLRYQDAYLSVGLTVPVDRGEDRSPLAPGEYAVASATSAELGGVLKVAIPVILAATIILNTMLGSVMERKKEISIYNAIGLNPTHVMVFFLAEAMVFGLVGAVAGYFVGQVLSVALGQFIDINLNYSSLSVMVVIFLTIATVMLSTLYPATLAARAAVPSGQRKWSLPRPEGDEISLRFPFSYDSHRILGICAYLHEFMQQNSEASTGRFLARLRVIGRVPSQSEAGDDAGKSHALVRKGGEALVLVYDIAPIPFDLGVNQKMEIYADYDPQVKAHMLSVHLIRESGDRDSWTTVNQPFLEALRKRLLSWRSQRREVQETYFKAGEELFRQARELETTGAGGTAASSARYT